MNRSLPLVAAVSLLALSGCTFDATEESKEGTDSIAQTGQGLGEFDARDALLAALGSATIDCLGTVGPSSYVADNQLYPTFKDCPTGDKGAATRIKALMALQTSKQGQKDQIGAYFAATWKKFQSSFPKEVSAQCPSWKKEKVFNAPSKVTVEAWMKGEGSNKENYLYGVYPAKDAKCQTSECVVTHAMTCAGGFGSQFLIGGSAKDQTVTVDPAWWLLDVEYEDDSENPFQTPGYYHDMSHYGTTPGALYGAVERRAEACSSYDWATGHHYVDAQLVPIDCGDGWECMSYCLWTPPVSKPSEADSYSSF